MVRKYNPMGNIEAFITPDDAEKIIDTANKDWHKLVFLMLTRTGRRISEVLELKVKDIKWESDSIKWHIKKKRNKDYTAIIPQDKHTIEILRKWRMGKQLDDDDFIFDSRNSKTGHYTRAGVNRLLKTIGKKLNMSEIGGEPIHPHHFRHGFAIHFVKTMDRPDQIFQLQKIMQHADIRETMWYLDHFGQTEMREMMDKMWRH